MVNEIMNLPAPDQNALVSIYAIGAKLGLDYKEVVFAALRAIGFTQKNAYHYLHPECAAKSANVSGSRYERKIRVKTGGRGVTLEEALAILADAAKVKGLLHGDVEVALKAADQYHKTRGHYDKKEIERDRVSPIAILLNLGKGEIGRAEYSLLDPRLQEEE